MNENPEVPRDLRSTCIHEYAHLAVARHFGASGFVRIARLQGHANASWAGSFHLYSDLGSDEWRIVALAGVVAERLDENAQVRGEALCEALRDARTLSDSDARYASGHDERDINHCLAIVKSSWREIETMAHERASSINVLYATLA